MEKFLNRYMRKFHRWLVVPFTALLIMVLLARGSATGSPVQALQQIAMLALTITGLYLLALPWWAKWRRKRRG